MPLIADTLDLEEARMIKLRAKLLLSIVAIISFIVVLLVSYNVWEQISRNEKDLKDYRSTLLEQSDQKIKVEVETVHSLVQDIYNQQQKGMFSEVEAKKKAADLVRSLRFDNGNYFWIDTAEGINVVLLGRDTEGKSRLHLVDAKGKKIVEDFITQSKKPEGGFTDYAFPKPNETIEAPKRSYVLLFKPYNWIIGTGQWVDDIDKFVVDKQTQYNEQLKRNIAMSVGIGVAVLLISGILASYISRKITDPIVRMVQNVQHIASGNLGIEEIPILSQDEVGVLGKSFNEMKANLQQLVKQVAVSSEQVAASSEELTASAEQSAQAASQIANSITEVSAGASLQVESAHESTFIVKQMVNHIEQMAAKTSLSATKSEEVANRAKAGGEVVEKAVAQMGTIEEAVTSSAQVVTKLGERSTEISQIVETIAGIASQTNLLALNAAIEAARAGEQGRGFAVVADEVRKLAEQSQEAAKKIADLIREIQEDTNTAVLSMNDGTQKVKSGAQVVHTAGVTFKEIVQLVSVVSSQVIEVSAAMQQMAAEGQKIVTSVQKIDELSKKSADESHSVSAAAEEQLASMEEIASSSQALAKLAEELQIEVAKFRL